MAEKSKILIIGGTGFIRQFIVRGRTGKPTFALVGDTAPSYPQKAKILDSFKNARVTLLKGDLNNQKGLVEAIKQVEIAISTVGTMQELEQLEIIAAIKEAEICSAVVLVKEEDIRAYNIKAADDLRMLNKILYIRPPANTYSFNEIVSLWEKKIEKTIDRIYFPEHRRSRRSTWSSHL